MSYNDIVSNNEIYQGGLRHGKAVERARLRDEVLKVIGGMAPRLQGHGGTEFLEVQELRERIENIFKEQPP